MTEKAFPWSRYERMLSSDRVISPGLVDTLSRIFQSAPPIVRHTMLWTCRPGWKVWERRIGDNLMLFVLDGAEIITCGSEQKLLRRGDMAIIPEFTSHQMMIAPKVSSCRHFIAHFLPADPVDGNPFAGFSSPFLHSENPDEQVRSVELIADLHEKHRQIAIPLLNDLVRRVMVSEAESGRFIFPGLRIRDSRICRALQFIRDHCQESISVQDIAKAVHLGEVRFRTLFREETGTLPGAALLRCRIVRAADDMIRNGTGVKEAAFRNGFSSASYFCVVFRQQMLMTPGEYCRNFFQA